MALVPCPTRGCLLGQRAKRRRTVKHTFQIAPSSLSADTATAPFWLQPGHPVREGRIRQILAFARKACACRRANATASARSSSRKRHRRLGVTGTWSMVKVAASTKTASSAIEGSGKICRRCSREHMWTASPATTASGTTASTGAPPHLMRIRSRACPRANPPRQRARHPRHARPHQPPNRGHHDVCSSAVVP